MSHWKIVVFHHECTETLTNAYFWPPNFENKGFHCDICLIVTQIKLKFPFFYKVSGCAFQYLRHTVQTKQAEMHITHDPVPLFWYGNVGALFLFFLKVLDFIYLHLTKHDNVWTFCRKKYIYLALCIHLCPLIKNIVLFNSTHLSFASSDFPHEWRAYKICICTNETIRAWPVTILQWCFDVIASVLII